MTPAHLRLPIVLAILAALFTLALKAVAYWVTGSVGLLSDALESLINLVASVLAYLALRYATRPADASHTYGHDKMEFFSSGLEGGLILVAAGGIAWTAVDRLVHPRPLEPLGLGLFLSLVAALVNGAVGLLLVRAGKRYGSIVLEADGQHLLTDVWTSAGVLAGLGLVALTGHEWLDPVLALLVAVNILWTAVDLMRRSFEGLMDHALPADEQERLREAIRGQLGPNMDYHAVRTRAAGSRRFVDFHLLVPGAMSVRQAHDLSLEVEQAIQAAVPGVEVTVHIEPIEERQAWQDSDLLPLEQADRLRRGEGPMRGVP